MIHLNGKIVAAKRRQVLAQKLQQLKREKNTSPGVAVILASPDPASQLYVRNKQKACQSVGIESFVHKYQQATQQQLQQKIEQLNQDPRVHGILVQLPLPPHINTRGVLDSIAAHKDIDALSTPNLGRLLTHQALVKPCTPMGILALLKHYKISIEGARVCVVGRSVLVGLPTALLLQAEGATVTLCHSGTKNLSVHTQGSDIVVVATGRKHLLGRKDFKNQAVVVDVGIHHQGGVITGDVNPEGLNNALKALTPVPGGVGPMTVTMLLENAYTLAVASLSGTVL